MVDSVSTVIHLSNDILLFYCKYWKLKAGKANMQMSAFVTVYCLKPVAAPDFHSVVRLRLST
jgi:hypothetical protein